MRSKIRCDEKFCKVLKFWVHLKANAILFHRLRQPDWCALLMIPSVSACIDDGHVPCLMPEMDAAPSLLLSVQHTRTYRIRMIRGRAWDGGHSCKPMSWCHRIQLGGRRPFSARAPPVVSAKPEPSAQNLKRQKCCIGVRVAPELEMALELLLKHLYLRSLCQRCERSVSSERLRDM